MKYSSLFTHPSQTSINRAFGEVKSRLNSSPLFTALHLCLSDNHKGGIRQIQLPGLLFLLEFDKHISLSLLDKRECSLMGEERWRVVKSCGNSSPRQTPCLSGFARERWRVKSIWQNSLPLHTVATYCHYTPIAALFSGWRKYHSGC